MSGLIDTQLDAGAQQIMSIWPTLTQQQRQQLAAAHMQDPIAMAAIQSADQQEKKMRQGAMAAQTPPGGQPPVNQQMVQALAPQDSQLPEGRGIGALPVGQGLTQMAEGGIVAFAGGDKVEEKLDPVFLYAANHTLDLEGGYVDDVGRGGPTNYGISQKAFPHLSTEQIKALTKDDALRLYKPYWDGIGGSALAKKDPALATAAFDTAINHGVAGAKRLLATSGADTQKLLAARGTEYQRLAESDPDKYAEQLPGWQNRLQRLAFALTPGSTANAATPPRNVRSAPAGPAELADQIPGGMRAPVPETVDNSRPLDWLPAAGDVLATLGTGTVAPLTGVARTGVQQLLGKDVRPIEENIQASIWQPRGEKGREWLESIGQVMRDAKIPAYMPIIGNSGTATTSVAKRNAAYAALNEAERAQATVNAARAMKRPPVQRAPLPGTVDPLGEYGMVPPGLKPPAVAAGADALSEFGPTPRPTAAAAATPAKQPVGTITREMLEARRGALNAAGDAAEDLGRQAGRAATQNRGVLAQESAGLTGNLAARAGHSAAPVNTTPPPKSQDDRAADEEALTAAAFADYRKQRGAGKERPPGGVPPEMANKAIEVAAASPAAKDAAKKGVFLSSQDLFMMGMAIMSGTSPHALVNIGEGGLKGLAGSRKLSIDEARSEYEKEMGERARKQGDLFEEQMKNPQKFRNTRDSQYLYLKAQLDAINKELGSDSGTKLSMFNEGRYKELLNAKAEIMQQMEALAAGETVSASATVAPAAAKQPALKINFADIP